MWAMPTLSQTMNTDPIRTYPIKTPQACHSSHQGNSTDPPYFIFLMHGHSFIHSHTRIHTFIRARIHTFIHACIHTCIQSIAYAIDASQCFVLRHEAEVASFNMSNDQQGFEGQTMKGSRPPHVKQSQGRKMQMRPSGPRSVYSEADRDISTFLVRS